MNTSRRNILAAMALAMPAAACGIISTATTNGVTVVTVNCAKVDAWAQAFQNGINLILGLPGMSALLGVGATVLSAVSTTITVEIAAFDKASGGATTFTFDSTSVPAMISSLLADGQKLVATVQASLPQNAIVGTVATYVNAIETVVSVFEATLGTSATAGALPPHAEVAALAVLGVKG